MTEEEIDKIAVAYYKENEDSFMHFQPLEIIAKDVIEFLLLNYCIVPKNKVIDLYNSVLTDDYIVTSSVQRLRLSRGIRFSLRKIFGKELFKRKGE